MEAHVLEGVAGVDSEDLMKDPVPERFADTKLAWLIQAHFLGRIAVVDSEGLVEALVLEGRMRMW